jgi:hypothetical protein
MTTKPTPLMALPPTSAERPFSCGRPGCVLIAWHLGPCRPQDHTITETILLECTCGWRARVPAHCAHVDAKVQTTMAGHFHDVPEWPLHE